MTWSSIDERNDYQEIRFDPTDLVISGAVPIDGTAREGYVTELSA